jgi:hypothetical protein
MKFGISLMINLLLTNEVDTWVIGCEVMSVVRSQPVLRGELNISGLGEVIGIGGSLGEGNERIKNLVSLSILNAGL